MTTQRGLDGTTKISFTPAQLVATFLFVLGLVGWGWKIDARTGEHDMTMKTLGAKLEKEIAEVKVEISELKMVCGSRNKIATTK